MRVHLTLGLGVIALLSTLSGLAGAAGWGGITPGKTTRAEVETLHGLPTRERVIAGEGHTAAEWTYTGDRAPRGLERMVVNFGLLRGDRFLSDLVRGVTLYPAPRVFTLEMIMSGWGRPDAIGTHEQTGRPALRYEAAGLLVVLDGSGQWAEILLLAPEKGAAGP